jgi:predicted RNA-binding protein with PUA-like domain
LRDAVAVGDGVLIYHSSCRPAGVAGVARVTRAAYPDPDQFDVESRYYDPKSREENPRWYRVDLAFEHKLPTLLALADIKANPQLEGMVLLRQPRLSVQPVTEAEWSVITTWARR